MIINNKPIIGSIKPSSIPQTTKQNTNKIQTDFGAILKEKVTEQKDVKLSKHAEIRLNARNISINPTQMERVKQGINKAEEKGIKDTLVLMDNLALVVNVKNRTIVTAAETSQLKENVFTNIDGAVIV